MSLGSWDPDAETAAHRIKIESAILERFINYSRQQQLEQLEELLSGDESQVLSGLMQVDHKAWGATAESLPDADLVDLIRFFAVAENLPGWEAGAQSPVIPLAKTLRRRGVRLDKSLLRWLREVSDNRYLPYGPL